jgi:hypothetical protein
MGELVSRVQVLLQDDAALAWQPAQVLRELDHALLRWARLQGAQALVWCQAVAGKTRYPLAEQGLTLTAGRDTSGAVGNTTTLTDATTNFLTLPDPVIVGDRVRNVTDRSIGTVTTANATTLVCGNGFTGGVQNAIDHHDTYIVERPLTTTRVVAIHAVLYHGIALWPMTVQGMDALTPGWDTQATGPKYWSVDQMETPTVVRIHPAPLVTGSSVPNFPMNPLPQRWEENLVIVLSEQPQQSQDSAEVAHVLVSQEDLLVYETAARLASFAGEWHNPSLQAGLRALLTVYAQITG